MSIYRKPATGLALSGGGFRATLFHVGALWRLNELGLLKTIDQISSVSGGSITSAVLGMRWSALKFDGNVANNFVEQVVSPLREFCGRQIDIRAVLRIAVHPWLLTHRGNALEPLYRRYLLSEKRLADLPDHPEFIFHSTNLMTGAPFIFSKSHAGDYKIGFISSPEFRLSEAVAASSAFPPIFCPFCISATNQQFSESGYVGLTDAALYRRRLYLGDGGIMDNLGVEYFFKVCNTLMFSDASASVHFKIKRHFGFLATYRPAEIAMAQAAPLIRRQIIDSFQTTKRGTYWNMDPELMIYGLKDSIPCELDVARAIGRLRTRLDRFSEMEQCQLINLGYAVCDGAMRLHVVQGVPRPSGLPFPDYPLDRGASVTRH